MPIPAQTLSFLSAESLLPLWADIRALLERNGLSPTGTITAVVDEDGADRLSGLFGHTIAPGRVRLKLEDLDSTLQSSAAAAGIVAVAAEVTGFPLTDRKQVKADKAAETARVAAALDDAVNARWFTPEQTQQFLTGVRRSGILTKAGTDSALRAIAGFSYAWGELSRAEVFDDPDAASNPLWGLGELAAAATSTAHGFDSGTVPSNLMMRALAVAFAIPVPLSGEGRRRLWEQAGVATDDVSGTAMTWGFRPPGRDRWSVMMRERAAQRLVTHLTAQELRAAGNVVFSEPGTTVFACENPQILSAAARAGVASPILCLSGQGSASAWQILRALTESGVTVRYHGDFDWPGVLIVGRVVDAGGAPWRMGADDYESAAGAGQFEPLDGVQRPTPWDDRLAEVMAQRGIAVHEEAIVGDLLGDMARLSSDPPYLDPSPAR